MLCRVDLLAHCVTAKKECVEELEERIAACKREQAAIWRLLTGRLRNAVTQIGDLRQLHVDWSSTIAQANITEQAVMKIVDDRFRVTFKQMKDYNLQQEEQIVEITAEMKKVSRNKEKLNSALKELQADRMRPNNFACSRAKYLVQGIAKDIRFKEKKAGLSLSAKLRKNLESIETLRGEGRIADDRLKVLLDQEKISRKDMTQQRERIPRFRVAARASAQYLQAQSTQLTEKLQLLTNIVAECGQIAMDQQRHNSQESGESNTPTSLFGDSSPLANLDQLLRETLYVTEGSHNPEWDLLSIVDGDTKMVQAEGLQSTACESKKFGLKLSNDEIVEHVLLWRQPVVSGGASTAATGALAVGRKTRILDLKPSALVSAVGDTSPQHVLSGVLAGCYSAFGASYRRQQLLWDRLQQQRERLLAVNKSLESFDDKSSPKKSTKASYSSKFVSFKRNGVSDVMENSSSTNQAKEHNIDDILPLDLMRYDLIELSVVLERAIEGLISLRCCSCALDANLMRQRLSELVRELRVPGLCTDSDTEILTCAVQIIQNSIQHSPKPLLIQNTRSVLAKYLLNIFVISNVIVELSASTVKSRWSSATEPFSRNFSDIESLSLRFLAAICKTNYSESKSTMDECDLEEGGTGVTNNAVVVMSHLRLIMMELTEVISEGNDAKLTAASHQPIQEPLGLPPHHMFQVIEIAMLVIETNPDPRHVPTIDFLDLLVRSQVSNPTAIEELYRSSSQRTPAFSILDRNTLLSYQVFLYALSNQEMTRYSLLDLIIRAVKSGHRLLPPDGKATGKSVLQANEEEPDPFPLHNDYLHIAGAVIPLFWPMFLSLHSLVRVIDLDLDRTRFILKLARTPHIPGQELDLRYLAVTLASDVQAAISQQEDQMARSSKTNSLRNNTASAAQRSVAAEMGIVVCPVEFTKVDGKEKERFDRQTQREAANSRWLAKSMKYLETICHQVADALWSLYDTIPATDDGEAGSAFIVPIHNDLRTRSQLLVHQLLQLCQSKQSAVSSKSVRELRAEMDLLLADIIRCRKVVLTASSALLRPWKLKNDWLQRQYRCLLHENSSGFEEISELRSTLGSIQDELTRYAESLTRARQQRGNKGVVSTTVSSKGNNFQTPAISVVSTQPQSVGAAEMTQIDDSISKFNCETLKQKLEDMKKTRDSKQAHLQSVTDIERVQNETQNAMRSRAFTLAAASIMDTAHRLRTTMIVTCEDDEDEQDDSNGDILRRGVNEDVAHIHIVAKQSVNAAVKNGLLNALALKHSGATAGIDKLSTALSNASSVRSVFRQAPHIVPPSESINIASKLGAAGYQSIATVESSGANDNDDFARVIEQLTSVDIDLVGDTEGATELPTEEATEKTAFRERTFFSFIGDSEFSMFKHATDDYQAHDLVVQTKVKYFNENSSQEDGEDNGSSDIKDTTSSRSDYASLLHPQFGEALKVNSFKAQRLSKLDKLSQKKDSLLECKGITAGLFQRLFCVTQ
jgi:hypothetical protein